MLQPHLIDWLGFTPKRQTKRLIKKWVNRYEKETRLYCCDHRWLKRKSRDSFDLICAKCHAITYTIPEE